MSQDVSPKDVESFIPIRHTLALEIRLEVLGTFSATLIIFRCSST